MKTKDQLVSLGLTDTKAEEVMMLESAMMERAMKFQFRKKDGSLRDAEGTLVREKMVREDGSLWTPTGPEKPVPAMFVRFWDLVAGDWRQFNVLNLISVEG